jgi:hypothetical protein
VINRTAAVADTSGVAEPSIAINSAAPRASLPMRLLAAGVPLSLLVDLTTPGGPDSAAIIAWEARGARSGRR